MDALALIERNNAHKGREKLKAERQREADCPGPCHREASCAVSDHCRELTVVLREVLKEKLFVGTIPVWYVLAFENLLEDTWSIQTGEALDY